MATNEAGLFIALLQAFIWAALIQVSVSNVISTKVNSVNHWRKAIVSSQFNRSTKLLFVPKIHTTTCLYHMFLQSAHTGS